MTAKYFYDNGGRLSEKVATVLSSGVTNAGDLVALNSAGVLDPSVLPTGVGAETVSLPATETINAGSLVNIWTSSGTPSVRNADNTAAGKEADGFVLATFSSGQTALVYIIGINNAVTGLVADTTYFLGTAGGVTATAPTGVGVVCQEIGKTTSTSLLVFKPNGRGWVKAS